MTLLNFIGVDDLALLPRVMLMRQKNDILALRSDTDLLPEFKPVNRRVKLVQFRSDAERVLYYLYAKFALETTKNSPYTLKRGKTPVIIQLMRQLCINPMLLNSLAKPCGMLTIGHHATVNGDEAINKFMAQQFKSFRLDYHAGETHNKKQFVDEAGEASEFKPLAWRPFLKFNNAQEKEHYRFVFDELTKEPGRWQVTEAMLANDDIPLERTKEFITNVIHRTLRCDMMSSKEAEIVKYVGETPADDQLIIYSFYTEVVDRLRHCIVSSGYKALVVTGKTKKTNKSNLSQYESDKAVKVLLMTLKLGSQGLNMINANHVLFVDPWWCPFPMEQAEFRIQRHGQLKDIFIVYFIMDHSIEVCIMNHTVRKKELLNLFVVDDEAPEEKSGLFDYKIDIVSLK
jgi:SNF2 family DNA or RNA helicase